MSKKFTSLAGGFDDVRRRDNIFKNNPVLVQGLGLTVVIFLANSLKNAAVVSLGMLLLCVGTHFFCYFLTAKTPYRLKMMAYALVCALLYIPTLMLLFALFGSSLTGVVAFLPLMVVDTLILSESEKVKRELFPDMFRHSITLAFGFAFVALLTGALRELVSAGTLWGSQVWDARLLPLMSSPIGGFITVALLAAMLQAFLNLYKKTLARRQKNIV